MKKLLTCTVVCALALGVYVASNTVVAQQADAPAKPVAAEKAAAEEKKTDPAFAKDIRRLLELTGAKDQGQQAMQLMLAQFKKTMPQVPVEFWDKFMKKIDMDELINMTVPIYAKYLTHEDVKGLIRFYGSPLGRRFVKAQPGIQRESMQAGMAWGQKVGKQVLQELQAEQNADPQF